MSTHHYIWWAAVIALLPPSSLTAQEAAATHGTLPVLTALPLAGDITVDGRFDDAAWRDAVPATLDTQRDPDEGSASTHRTEIRAAAGHGAVYFFARMYDSNPAGIVRRLGRRDDRVSSDRLTLVIDSRHDHLTAFRFDIYPAGNKGDRSIGADFSEDSGWDPVWDVVTTIDSLGWTAEIRIPLSQLRYERGNDEWGIQIVRFVQRTQEEDVFVYVPKTETEGINRYGHLTGMSGVPSPRRLELTPFLSARAQYDDPPAGNPFRDGSDYYKSAGGDLKLGLASDLTLDLTVNPDFGQVEADPAVVNLSAFEITFPEKRPFFIEGSSLFRFHQLRAFNYSGTPTVFFSRRIGRQPQGFIGDPNATYTDVPAQTTIAAAAKMTGKTRGWSIALLDAYTPREMGRYALANASHHEAPVEPATNYFATRIRRDLREGNTSIGAITTAVNRSLEDSTLRSLLRSSAYVVGVDLNHSWGNRNWGIDAYYARSVLNGSPEAINRAQRANARYLQRPDAKNLDYDSTRTTLSGHAGHLGISRLGGGALGGSVVYEEKSPGYETNDLGTTATVGRRTVSTDLHYFRSRPQLAFRNWTVGVNTGNSWNFDGDAAFGYVGSYQNVRFRNFWSLNSNIYYNFAAFDDQVTRGGPLMRVPANTFASFTLQSSTGKALGLSFNGSFNWFEARGGRTGSYGLTLSYQPDPALRVELSPTYSDNRVANQFVTSRPDPLATATFGRRTVFAALDQRQVSLDTRLDWTFNPRLSLQLFVQPFISAGDYRDYKEFRRPGTFDFDVYGVDKGTIVRDSASGAFTVDPDAGGPAPAFSFQDQNFNFRSFLANLVIRWEPRPGSTLFFVWQHSRSGQATVGAFSLHRDLGAIFDTPATNVVAVKATYWFGL